MPEKPQVPELPTKSSFYQAVGHVLSEQLSAIKLERVKTQILLKARLETIAPVIYGPSSQNQAEYWCCFAATES